MEEAASLSPPPCSRSWFLRINTPSILPISASYSPFLFCVGRYLEVLLAQGPRGGGSFYSSMSDFYHAFLRLHISTHPTSVPAATPALIIAIFALPNNFPYHGKPTPSQNTWKTKFSKQSRAKIDGVGATLLLFATLSITAAFGEAGSRFPWKSAYVISLLSVSGLLWITLLTWERYVTNRSTTMEPVLPWRFFKNRTMLSLLM